jgi:transcriptional regulator PpsR
VGHVSPGAQAITAAIKSVNIALPDVTLRLDMEGVIREASLANAISREGVADWVGRPWVETVGPVGSEQVRRMVADARVHGVSDFRQVTQNFPSGLELPIEYNAVCLGGNAGLIAIGRNLRAVAGVQSRLIAAQHAREQDAWKLRTVETRYRLLFDASAEPVLLLRPDDLFIIDANPAAIRAGFLDGGWDFSAAVAAADQPAFQGMMMLVAERGRAPGMKLHVGAASTPWLIRASLALAEPATAFLVQLAPAAPLPSIRGDAVNLDHMIERLPDGFVLLDATGIVRRANRAFLDLVQVAAAGAVLGQPISRWLSRPGADAAVLLTGLQRHRIIRGFATTLQGELGSELEVEISAAGDRDARPLHIGLMVRDISRRPTAEPLRAPSTDSGEQLLGTLVRMTEQIGETPLLQLVRDTGGVIERHYILGALEKANGNRTQAAELLGLSRQSLYAKLSRYGMVANVEDKAGGD